jgi:RNA polymerase sigma-70 factor (ECF subfamily)
VDSETLKSNILSKDASDEVLVEMVKSGSEIAFNELVKRYMKKAHSIAYQFVGNSQDAKDLSQDVFIKIYQSISSFKEGYKFFSWFYRILLNHCINFKKRKHILDDIDELKGHNILKSSDETFLDDEINLMELKEIVHNAISKLPLRQRKVVILCEIEGFSQNDASKILNISEGTVRSRLFYAKKRLKKYLKDYLK